MEMREQSQVVEPNDKDLTLNEGQLEEVAHETDVNCETAEVAAEIDPVAADAVPVSKDDVLATAKALAAKDAENITREEIAHVKQQFYAIRKSELEVEKAAFLEKGNEEAAFAPMTDVAEEEFKAVLNEIKGKKAAHTAAVEAQRVENYDRKNAIIEQLCAMSAEADNVNREFPRFKELQQEFKAIGEVPATVATEQWKKYQDAVEHFYDQLKVNKDLRDYDFKKNLDTKNLLCEEAERLADESDVIVAFRRLQDLHEKWRETGPVAKEIREEIWTRFKDASAVVNKKYQAFFEERKAREQENETAKTAICERVEALDLASLDSYAAWDEMTKTILEAQDDWKKLGFASKKSNNLLFARFRATCDKFFAAKAEYYKSVKDRLSVNLEKKIALCEQAEALKDSTDWKKTADKLVELQKQWKTIGAVSKKHSDAVWQRFLTACDYFFEQKKKNQSGTRQVEQANLKAKKAVIAALKDVADDAKPEDVQKLVKDSQAQWQQIGHVPFKEKDKVYEDYRAAVNALYEKFDLNESRANMSRFENAINEMGGNDNRLYRERERLVRAYEQKRAEMKTCENNLGFFTSKSKSGDSMLRELERRISRIKDDLGVLEQKIALIDSKL